ncbi:putative iron-regulated protein [Desulfosoma caldarium]|uniref:Putative iron-regulated protein n=2 Tax=Desulfosoma caldarium TaxID=610254 RepID=A0A3N1ULD5_9BACT|nr:putative iron-regulated protein [Desulfosoma caldarium]
MEFKPAVNDIVDLHTGRKLDFNELLSELEKARVIYVGEVHSRQADHEVQRRIVEGLWRRGKKIGVGLEMLPRGTQREVDRWVQGELEETAFLEAVHWNEYWGFPFALYRPLFVFAREQRIPLRALNAPPAVVRKVSRQGLASLSDDERQDIARHFFTEDAAHRAFIEEEYKAHVPGGIRDLESFYEAQLVWDETMAESLAVWLVQNPLDHVVVLAGKGHVNQRFGIPERVRRRVEHRYAVVVPEAVNEGPERLTPAVGDFLVVTPEEKPFPGHGLRLGVRLERNTDGAGVRVLDVVPGSRAEQAGFRPGDRIVAVDGQPVSELNMLHQMVQQRVPELVFTLERDGRTVTATVRFEP